MEGHDDNVKIDDNGIEDVAAIHAALLQISNQSSKNRFQPQSHAAASKRDGPKKSTLTKDIMEGKTTTNHAETFLSNHIEKGEMNQYWYSPMTIKTLCDAILEVLDKHDCKKVAFLSTPSLYFALPDEARQHCKLFDIDSEWQNDPGFHYYDFNEPKNFENSLLHSFDMVVIDPPFVTRNVWEEYTTTAKALLRYSPCTDDNESICPGFVFATTLAENHEFMYELFHAKATVFKPKVTNLVYQYKVYINCIDDCCLLQKKNPEIIED